MRVTSLDHLVLTVRDVEVTCRWYESVLGMTRVTFGAGRVALTFGEQKINLHRVGQEFDPKATAPTPGSADLCFLTDVPLSDVQARLIWLGVALVEGPIERTGATGPILSVYVRDTDGNLVEIANQLSGNMV